MTSTRYSFEWDPIKAKQNLRKHKVSFGTAATVFLDRLAVSVPDDEHSETEERWVTLGQPRLGSLLVVIHTFRELAGQGVTIRIISARPATRRERERYEENR